MIKHLTRLSENKSAMCRFEHRDYKDYYVLAYVTSWEDTLTRANYLSLHRDFHGVQGALWGKDIDVLEIVWGAPNVARNWALIIAPDADLDKLVMFDEIVGQLKDYPVYDEEYYEAMLKKEEEEDE